MFKKKVKEINNISKKYKKLDNLIEIIGNINICKKIKYL